MTGSLGLDWIGSDFFKSLALWSWADSLSSHTHRQTETHTLRSQTKFVGQALAGTQFFVALPIQPTLEFFHTNFQSEPLLAF